VLTTDVHNDGENFSVCSVGNESILLPAVDGSDQINQSAFDVDVPMNEADAVAFRPGMDGTGVHYDVEEIKEPITFANVLAHVKCMNSVPASWIEEIMNACRATNCFPGANRLPKKWKTIAKVSAEAKRLKVPIQVFPLDKNGEYCHFGLENMLKLAEENLWLEAFGKNKEDHPHRDRPIYEIDVNIDGADVSRQGSQQSSCWPILIRVHSIQPNEWSEKKVLGRMMAPLTVGIYIGKGKPHSSTVYLERFAHELYHLNPRYAEEEEPFCVTVRAIIADTPARAFIKLISSAQGYFPCEKCTEIGTKPSNHCHLSIWKIKGLRLRTNEKFYTYTCHVKHVRKLYI